MAIIETTAFFINQQFSVPSLAWGNRRKLSPRRCKGRTGFTLIEILVVTALVSVVAATATQIFSQILRSNQKARAILEVKQVGDNALTVIANKIRNAKTISSVCDVPASNTITIIDSNNTEIDIVCSSAGIALGSESLIGADLTLTNYNSCFRCYSYEGSPELVEVGFTLSKTGEAFEDSELNFSTTVSLRNY